MYQAYIIELEIYLKTLIYKLPASRKITTSVIPYSKQIDFLSPCQRTDVSITQGRCKITRKQTLFFFLDHSITREKTGGGGMEGSRNEFMRFKPRLSSTNYNLQAWILKLYKMDNTRQINIKRKNEQNQSAILIFFLWGCTIIEISILLIGWSTFHRSDQ